MNVFARRFLPRLRVVGCTVLLAAVALSPLPQARAQAVNPLVDEAVQLRIEQQEIAYLWRTGQLSREEYQQRSRAFDQHNRDYSQRLAHLPVAQQQALRQQIDNRFALVFPPIQQKWNAEAQRLQEEARALAAKRSTELETDARAAAQWQTDRVFLQRHLQQNTISPQDAQAKDAADLTQLTALQNKYTSYGGNWAQRFNGRVQQLTDQLVQQQDLKERLADTTSEVGKDAHRAADLSLAMQRNQTRRAVGVLNYAQEDQANSPFKAERQTIQSKYSTGGALAASARDFNERLNNLVQQDVRENRDQWEREARAEYAAKQSPPATALTQRPVSPAANPAVQRVQQQPRAAQEREATYSVVGYLGYLALLGGACVLSFGGKNELDAADARKLRAGGRLYKLYSATGTVMSPTKDREVRTHVSGGYNNVPISTSTTTITHLEFFLKRANGEETPFHITSSLAQAALRDGHKLSAVWGIREGKSSGYYFLFRNHSTGQIVYDDGVLHGMVSVRRPWNWLVLTLSAPTCVGLLAYALVAKLVARKRAGKVKQQINERLIPQLDSLP